MSKSSLRSTQYKRNGHSHAFFLRISPPEFLKTRGEDEFDMFLIHSYDLRSTKNIVSHNVREQSRWTRHQVGPYFPISGAWEMIAGKGRFIHGKLQSQALRYWNRARQFRISDNRHRGTSRDAIWVGGKDSHYQPKGFEDWGLYFDTPQRAEGIRQAHSSFWMHQSSWGECPGFQAICQRQMVWV